MKIAILGPKGTYSEEAAKKHDRNAEIICCKSITHVFESINDNKANAGIAPTFNKFEGANNETLDCLWQYGSNSMHQGNDHGARITDIIVLDIVHCIGTLHNASKIKKILSKREALRQCSRYIDGHYPYAERTEAASTAQAIEDIVKQNLYDAAAIGSEAALMQYGLEVIDNDIVKKNKTLFAVVSKNCKTEPTGKDITTIAIRNENDEQELTNDIKGILCYSNIKNTIYPIAKGMLGAIQYVDIEGHENESHVANAIDLIKHYLKKKPGEFKILGSYKKPIAKEDKWTRLRKGN